MNDKTLKALDRALDRIDRSSRRPRRGFSSAPIVLALGMFLGFQLLTRLVPRVWSTVLPGGLDQAEFLRGWPGLLWRLVLLCHWRTREAMIAGAAISVVGWLLSRGALPFRILVWLTAVGIILIDGGIVYVTLRAGMDATIQGAGLN